jgi:Kef-type K+ transport system membrane component KefB
LFFAYSAIVFDIASLYNSFLLILALVVTGILAKLFGSGLFSRFYNFKKRDQWLIGVGMVPRGEYGIIIAQIALGAAIITAPVYTALIAAIIITVILTPILMRLIK